jgi:hypothetical protein
MVILHGFAFHAVGDVVVVPACGGREQFDGHAVAATGRTFWQRMGAWRILPPCGNAAAVIVTQPLGSRHQQRVPRTPV